MIIQLTTSFSVELTYHAIEQIEYREINYDWIRESLLNPIKIDDDPNDPLLKWAFGKIDCADGKMRVLKVVYNDSETPWKVITLHFDRGAKRKLL